jgi:hypothetical protein
VRLHDSGDRRSPHAMPEVLECSLNAGVTPCGVLFGHPHDQPPDLEQHGASARPPGVGPLPGNQLAMPPQQRVGRRDRGDVSQDGTADAMRMGGQPTAILVREAQPTSTKLMPKEPVLLNQVGNRLPLPAVEPAAQHAQHHLQRRGVNHEPELISRQPRRMSAQFWDTTGPSVDRRSPRR